MHPETRFRISKVLPFLKRLRNTAYFPIQQLAILGDPDFMLCSRGHYVALELKVDDVPRPLQERKLARVKKCGGIAIVANPENWFDVAQWLHELDQTGEIPPWPLP